MPAFTETDRKRFYQILSEKVLGGSDALQSTTLNPYSSDEVGYNKRLQFYAGLTHACYTGSGWAYCNQNPLMLMISDTVDPLVVEVETFDGWGYNQNRDFINARLAERGWSHEIVANDNLQTNTISTTETRKRLRLCPLYMYCWYDYWYIDLVIKGTEAV